MLTTRPNLMNDIDDTKVPDQIKPAESTIPKEAADTGRPEGNIPADAVKKAIHGLALKVTTPGPKPKAYESIEKAIRDALTNDEPFTYYVDLEGSGLQEKSIFIAIEQLRHTKKITDTEADELVALCERTMLDASNRTSRRHKVRKGDIAAAKTLATALSFGKELKQTPYEEMLETIADARRTHNFTCFVYTDSEFSLEEKHILEAIFWERKAEKITTEEAFRLIDLCVHAMIDTGIEGRVVDAMSINTAGLFKDRAEIIRFIDMLKLAEAEKAVFDQELDHLRGIPHLKAVRAPSDETPAEVEAPRVTMSRTRKLAFAALGASVLAAGAFFTVNSSSRDSSPGTPAAPTAKAPAQPQTAPSSFNISKTDETPALAATPLPKPKRPADQETKKPATDIDETATTYAATVSTSGRPAKNPFAITPGPTTASAGTAPSPTKAPASAAPAPQQPEQPPQPKPATKQPTEAPAPESIPPQSIEMPIITTKKPFGGTTFDETKTKALWENAGWTVKAYLRSGSKVFMLSKNGRYYIIENTRITPGQTTFTSTFVR